MLYHRTKGRISFCLECEYRMLDMDSHARCSYVKARLIYDDHGRCIGCDSKELSEERKEENRIVVKGW